MYRIRSLNRLDHNQLRQDLSNHRCHRPSLQSVQSSIRPTIRQAFRRHRYRGRRQHRSGRHQDLLHSNRLEEQVQSVHRRYHRHLYRHPIHRFRCCWRQHRCLCWSQQCCSDHHHRCHRQSHCRRSRHRDRLERPNRPMDWRDNRPQSNRCSHRHRRQGLRSNHDVGQHPQAIHSADHQGPYLPRRRFEQRIHR